MQGLIIFALLHSHFTELDFLRRYFYITIVILSMAERKFWITLQLKISSCLIRAEVTNRIFNYYAKPKKLKKNPERVKV